MASAPLPLDLEEQAGVVASYGQYPVEQFRRVALEWVELADNLGCSENSHRVGEGANANVVRVVTLGDDRLAVLKVSVTESHNEAHVLGCYQGEPVISVPLLGHGVTTGGCPWVLTGLVDGREPLFPLADATVGEASHLAAKARERTAGSRGAPAAFTDARAELKDAVRHARVGLLNLLRDADHPADVLDVLERLSDGGADVLTHGDFRSRNTLRTDTGKLLLLDPAGALGPPENDMSTWIAIAASRACEDPSSSVAVATAADPAMAAQNLGAWVALRMLLLAEAEPRTGFLRRDPAEVVRCLGNLLGGLLD